MVIVFKKSLLKSAAAKAFVREAKFNYFKEKILEHLDKLEAKEKKEQREVKKALFAMESLKKAGFPVGTVREWKGKKYIKTAPGKWRPKYEADSRGAKLSIAAIKRKVDACATVDELLQVVKQNKHRFVDANGQYLPFVKEMFEYVAKAHKKIKGANTGGSGGGGNGGKGGSGGSGGGDDGGDGEDGNESKIFGRNYSKFTGKGKAAIEKLLKEKNGYVKAAFHKEGIGDIDVVYGAITDAKRHKGYGLAHILDKHPETTPETIEETIQNGEISDTFNGYDIETDDYIVGINRGFKQDGRLVTRNNWVVTTFNKKNPQETSAIAYAGNSTGETVSPPNLLDNPTLPQSDDSVNEKNEKNEKISRSPGITAIRARYEMSPSVEGNKKTVVLPDGSKVKCQYRVVEAEAPSASHDEVTFSPTLGFPANSEGKTINDRDYQHDKDAQESVRRIANNFNALAIDSPPIVTKDGIVISGNNRTMSSKLAAKHGTDSEYLKFLREQADEYGFEASDLDDFEHPRVILEVVEEHKGEYTTEEFAQFNRDTKKTMNNVEKAVKITKTLDSEKIKNIADCLDGFETMGELYQDKKGGSKFVQALVGAGVILDNEKAQYLTSDGLLNDTGKDFVETVLVGSVLTEENIRHCDGAGGKSIRKKLVRAILPLIENKGNGKEYSFNAELNEATAIALEVSKNHEKFGTVKDYLDQLSLFDEKKIDGVTARLAEVIHDDTEKNFAARMKGLGAGLRQSAEGLQDIFLGGVETKDDLMRRFLEVKKAVAAVLKKVFGVSKKSA